MGGGEKKYIAEAFSTNWISTIGDNITGFENELEQYLGNQSHVAALITGTAAIHLALLIAGVTKDDDVLCQTLTFCGSAHPILYIGAKPVFIDSELDTWNMSPFFLEEAIKEGLAKGKKPKAVILVHIYGMPAKIEEIEFICNKYDIFLIEDAAEALGSSYNGRKCGTYGNLSILSFNGNKIITTSGGGALVCRDAKTKDYAIFLATHAKDNAPFYQHSEIGYNYRMSNIVAGIGRGQMEVLNAHVELRRQNHDFYHNLFADKSEVVVFKEPSKAFFSNHWLTVIRFNELENVINSENLRLYLLKFNIESRPVWKPMHMQPMYANEKYFGNGTSEYLFKNGLCLPSGSNLTNEQKNKLKTVINDFFS